MNKKLDLIEVNHYLINKKLIINIVDIHHKIKKKKMNRKKLLNLYMIKYWNLIYKLMLINMKLKHIVFKKWIIKLIKLLKKIHGIHSLQLMLN